MVSRRFLRIWLLAGLGILGLLVLPAKGMACEKCATSWNVVLSRGQSWCQAVKDGETGATQCDAGVTWIGGAYCHEGGIYCSTVTAGGGGGGGSTCQSSGYCPAECFSCSGGTPKT